MLFNSGQFVLFFWIVAAAYFLLPPRVRWLWLLGASLYFYMAWRPVYVLLLLASVLVDYAVALALGITTSSRLRKLLLTASLATNLGLLFTFKYFNFAARALRDSASLFGIDLPVPASGLLLPLGISFYTFQALSYTIDVYRRRIEPERDPARLALYVSFFPQLVAGPIERATRLLHQLGGRYEFDAGRVGGGLLVMISGLFLKTGVADRLAPFVDHVFGTVRAYAGLPLLLAGYGFALQIYCDFAGYSLIAIGAAEVLGVRLVENFRHPYLSLNISEFWRRWHISLSTWFRDYVFSPFYLYVSRRKRFSAWSIRSKHGLSFFVTLMATELLLGFWHGANWNFGLFGLYHGLLIWLYYVARGPWDRMPRWLQRIATFHLVVLGFVIFRCQSMRDLAYVVTHLVALDPRELAVVVVVGIGLAMMEVVVRTGQPLAGRLLRSSVAHLVAYLLWSYALLAVLVYGIGEFRGKEFIYFRF